MSRWFRFYDDAINHPKVLRMPEAMRWQWVAVLCIASKNEGVVRLSDIPIYLRVSDRKAEQIATDLKERVLLDEIEPGVYKPHDWNGRQYKTDVTDPTNADRQKRYRDRHRVTENTVTDTVTVTDTRAETEHNRKKDIRAVAKATRPMGDHFEAFKTNYPKRKGANPWPPAQKLFATAVKSGVDPGAIIAAVRAGVGFDRDKIGTEYIPQAVKWLRDRRWLDHESEPVLVDLPGFYAPFGSEQLDAWDAHRRATAGKTYPRDKAGGWRFETEWPPGHEKAA